VLVLPKRRPRGVLPSVNRFEGKLLG
jgi:hypothetical protein